MKLGKMFKMPKVVPNMSKMTGIKTSDLGIKPKRRKRPTIKSIINNT